MTGRACLGGLLLTWIVTGCVGEKRYPLEHAPGPLPAPMGEVLVVAPYLPPIPEVPDEKLLPVMTAWRQTAIHHLSQQLSGRFKVVAANEEAYHQAEEELFTELGIKGFYEPVTGKFQDVLFRQFARKLARKLGAKAYVSMSFVPVASKVIENTAYWDGASAGIMTSASLWIFGRGEKWSGAWPAFSLKAELRSAEGTVLWVGQGGHRLLDILPSVPRIPRARPWDEIYPLDQNAVFLATVERAFRGLIYRWP